MTENDVAPCAELFVERHAARRASNPLYPTNLDTVEVVGQLISSWLSTSDGIVAEQDGTLIGYLNGRAVTGLGGVGGQASSFGSPPGGVLIPAVAGSSIASSASCSVAGGSSGIALAKSMNSCCSPLGCSKCSKNS